MEEEFEVHGAHDHQVEHEAAHGVGLSQQVAIFTAILATIGAVVSYLGGHTQNEALYLKNEAVLLKAQASDQWSFYQAKSSKGHLMELALVLVPADQQDHYRKEVARYDGEKNAIKAKAEALEEQSRHANEESEHALHPHQRLAIAMTFIQVAIALGSVTALTRKRWLLVPAVGAALAGCGLAIFAYVP